MYGPDLLCRNPTAMMTPSRMNLGAPAPLAATFSARGPNSITSDILKVIMSVYLGLSLTTSNT